jgi:hypothetical protein
MFHRILGEKSLIILPKASREAHNNIIGGSHLILSVLKKSKTRHSILSERQSMAIPMVNRVFQIIVLGESLLISSLTFPDGQHQPRLLTKHPQGIESNNLMCPPSIDSWET